MKTTIIQNVLAGIVVSASLSIFTTASAAPLVSIGEEVDVYFSGSSSLSWSSNVFRDEDDEQDDLIWTISPGLEVNVGRGLSNADFSIITRYDIIRYSDRDQLDTELFHIRANGSYKGSRLDLNGSLSFDESKTSSGDVNVSNDLVEFDTVGARLDGEYRISPKFSFGAGIRYTDKEYSTFEDRFADRETTTLPFDVFYELTPKVDLSLGYTYTQTDVESTNSPVLGGGSFFVSDYETSSHFFNIGARGNLLPKLTGFFKVGYRFRDSDDSTTGLLDPSGALVPMSESTRSRDSNGILGLDANFTWAATPKLSATLALSRDFGVDGEGGITENSSIRTSLIYTINTNWSASSNIGFTLRDYDNGREDYQYDVGARLSYVPDQHWRFSGGYNYSENNSNISNRNYVNHTLDFSASLRY